MPETTRKGPIRTCAGCQHTAAPDALVRFVLAPDGALVPDLAGGAFGHGAWVHPRAECLARAVPRGFARTFRAPVTASPREVWQALHDAADRRVISLIRAAIGARKLVVGSTAVDEELRAGRALLVIVARDARAAASSREVEAAVAKGRALAWGDKSALGLATGREQTGIVGVLDGGLARSLQKSIELCHVPEPRHFAGKASTEE